MSAENKPRPHPTNKQFTIMQVTVADFDEVLNFVGRFWAQMLTVKDDRVWLKGMTDFTGQYAFKNKKGSVTFCNEL